MSSYYIKYDSAIWEGREFWLASDDNWVEYQGNAKVFNNLELAKQALLSNLYEPFTNRYKIVQQSVSFNTVFNADQLISVRLNNLADNAWGYTLDHIADEIRKIAKEIKQ